MRDRLTVVVRSALLDSLNMNAEDERKTFRAEIDQTSIREEFSDLTLLKGDRVLAGAYISYNATIDEIVHREDIAEVDEIEVGYKANNPLGVAVSLPADDTNNKFVVERPQ